MGIIGMMLLMVAAIFLYWLLLIQFGFILINLAKPVVAAILAFLIGNSHRIVANGWGNWFIWLAIFLAVLYALSLLRYLGMAINFFCGLCIGSLGLRLIAQLSGMMISTFTGNDRPISSVLWLILTVVACFFAIGYAIEGDEQVEGYCTGTLPVLQAIFAAPIYGFAITFSCLDLCLRLWPTFVNVGDYLLIGSTVLALVIQIFAFCIKK